MKFKMLAVLVFLGVAMPAIGQVAPTPPPITDTCLGCICEASSGCNLKKSCNGGVCGLFSITRDYWDTAGRPTLKGESPTSDTAYVNCATDQLCAAATVQNYMQKFGQDCNADNVIDCYDYGAIHQLGGYGCKGQLTGPYASKFNQCLVAYNLTAPPPPPPASDICLGCICEASSGCSQTKSCIGGVCGLFSMTWAYWEAAGKLTLKGESPSSDTAFANCANDPYCAASTVQNYMQQFAQDCNGDYLIDCYDYGAIHSLGGYGCKGALNGRYASKLNQCLAAFNQNG